MEVVNESLLIAFAKNHASLRQALSHWRALAESAQWKSFADIRTTFRSADYVRGHVIFDIGGNNYRLISSVDYAKQRVRVLSIMTHAEYDRWKA